MAHVTGSSAWPSRGVSLAIIVAALGYFVDIYDLILFSIVRIASLRSIAVLEDQILSQGVLLLNMQMGGMLVGGLIWGILGDRRGGLSVLFGSIVLYFVVGSKDGRTVPRGVCIGSLDANGPDKLILEGASNARTAT